MPLDVLHNAQQSIGDMIDSAARAGDAQKAKALTGVRNTLLDQMDAASPEYQAARRQYATDKGVENALQNGRNIAQAQSNGQVYDPALLRSQLPTSSGQLQAFQQGARKSLSDIMGQARSDAAGVASKLSNENGYAGQKYAEVFGPQGFGENGSLNQRLDALKTMQQTDQLAAGGSKTAMASAADNLIPGATSGGGGHGSGNSLWGGAMLGRELAEAVHPSLAPVGAVAGAVAGPTWKHTIGATLENGNAATRQAMASALTQSDPAKVNALVRALNVKNSLQWGRPTSAGAGRLASALAAR